MDHLHSSQTPEDLYPQFAQYMHDMNAHSDAAPFVIQSRSDFSRLLMNLDEQERTKFAEEIKMGYAAVVTAARKGVAIAIAKHAA